MFSFATYFIDNTMMMNIAIFIFFPEEHNLVEKKPFKIYCRRRKFILVIIISNLLNNKSVLHIFGKKAIKNL